MKVLIGCEFSGTVRDAFIEAGHDAVSCDLLPTEHPGPHIQGDVLNHLHHGWDLAIFHPQCTFLANSGVRWLYRPDGGRNELRWHQMAEAAKFFLKLLHARIPLVAVENPIMHKHGRAIIGRGQDQVIQPWQFGHGEIKATCFWLNGLPPLEPTDIVDGRQPRVHHASPSPDRWKQRSITLPGIARAMAAQWGKVVVPAILSTQQGGNANG